ncbi:GAF domain-containing protein, partial [Kitasatospora sp. NPDC048365]|uniref:GAF domain-containing protein n=1 Tax=Kitasatospora sp. NPDC048365 TaxID=3364050 RepID=UPI0037134F47
MVDQPNSTPNRGDMPGGHPAGVVALLRVAAVLVDPDGRIAQWNRTAEELFGHRAEVAFGRSAHGLLPAVEPRGETAGPAGAGRRCDALDTLDDLTRLDTPWAGAMAVHDREERLRDVLWWAYPLIEPVGRSLLALAADARPLRAAGPRLALGDSLYAAAPGGGRPHRVAAAFAPPGPTDPAALAPLLPKSSEERRARLLAQLAEAGLPALWVDATTRLPVVPYQPSASGTARLAAGIGRRYPTPQQRAARRPPEPQRPVAGRILPTAEAPPSGEGRGLGTTVPGQRGAQPRDTDGTSTAHGPTPGGPTIDAAANGRAPAVPDLSPNGTAHRTAEVPPQPAAPNDGVEVVRGVPDDNELALLSTVGSQVGTTLDLDTTAHELCEVLVRRVADFACVDLLDGLISDAELPDAPPDDRTELRRVARAFNPASGQWDHVLDEGALLTMPASTPPGLALQENKPVLVPTISPDVAVEYAISIGGPELVPVVAGRSMLVLPLSARGKMLGILKLLRLPDRAPFTRSDADTLQELAVRAALSLDNA